MKHFYIWGMLSFFFIFGCNVNRDFAISTEEIYLYKQNGLNQFKDECLIKLNENKSFSYTCSYIHVGTAISGTWERIKGNKIVIKMQKEDIMPAYPENFYKAIDTLYIINDTALKSNNKIFLLKRL